jgi:hypothetical protein
MAGFGLGSLRKGGNEFGSKNDAFSRSTYSDLVVILGITSKTSWLRLVVCHDDHCNVIISQVSRYQAVFREITLPNLNHDIAIGHFVSVSANPDSNNLNSATSLVGIVISLV